MNPNRLWYVCLQDECVGPMMETTIYCFIRNQRLGGHDYVWREGLQSWTHLSATPEFSGYFAKTPRVLPPLKAPAFPTVGVPTKHEAKAQVTVTKPDGTVLNRGHRVPIEGWIRFDAGDLHKVLNISESGILVSIPQNVPMIGKEVRFKLESPVFGRPMDMTGVLIREDFSSAENAVAIEFTRLNPAYRRLIKEYVQQNEKKAA